MKFFVKFLQKLKCTCDLCGTLRVVQTTLMGQMEYAYV